MPNFIEAGGLGVLGAHAGQNSLPKDDVERAERMRMEIRKVKELTKKPFGINIFHSGQNPDVQLQLMLKVVYEEKVPVAIVAQDSPDIAEDIIKELKSHGVTVVYHHLNLTPELAIKAEKAGADILVATGMDEGGTLPGHNIGRLLIKELSMRLLPLGQKEHFVELFSFRRKKQELRKMLKK